MQTDDLSRTEPPPPQRETDHAPKGQHQAEAMRLRARILGVLIHQNRLAASRSIEECATYLQVQPREVECWEYGDQVPSLPQLELFAQFLKVPVSQFWQGSAPETTAPSTVPQDQFVALRQRLVGGLLRAARESKNLSIEQLGRATSLDADVVEEYESGARIVPMNHLLALANAVERNVDYFLETEELSQDKLLPAPNDLQLGEADRASAQTTIDQKTQGIIKLAVAFSHIPSEELHRIADALLAISRAKSKTNGV